MDGFKKEGVRPLGQFAIGADGGLEVRQNLSTYGYTVVTLCFQRSEFLLVNGDSSEIEME